jgi:hypothetical protein
VTLRDRMVIVVVLLAAALAGFWFLGIAPKHKAAGALQAKITTERLRLTAAQQKAAAATQAKDRYRTDYAAVAALGKAVPKSDALPSLIYQLQAAAGSARIDFRSLKVAASGGSGPTPAPAAATPAAKAATTTSTGSTTGTGTTGSTPAAGGTSSTGGTAAAPAAPASGTAAPATQAAAAALPPGAVVGAAGFPTMPFAFVFDGTFFDMETFMSEVQRFVRVNGKHVDVRGRLLSIDGFSLSAGPGGFPKVKASINATAYLLSPDDSSATPSVSAGTDAAATTGSSAAAGGAAAAPPAAASEVAR